MNTRDVKPDAYRKALLDGIEIRPALAHDLDALVDLEVRTFTTDRLSRAQYRRHVRGESAIVLVAARGQEMLGSVVAFLRRGSDEARLYSVAVSDQARGKGLGDALVEAIESAVSERGQRRIRLEVRQDNPSAIGLYERRGYECFGQISGFYEDGADAWRYRKSLD